MTATADDGTARAHVGTYGLRLRGVEAARSLLATPAPGWPTVDVSIELEADETSAPADALAPDTARYRFTAGGHVVVQRSPRLAVFRFPDEAHVPPVRHLVHPYLCTPLATIHYWNGTPAFHGGAFIVDGGAWVVLGAKGAGKSTLLATLGTLGVPVLTDDLAIVPDDRVLSGPRCIDLRADAAQRLGVGDNLGVVGVRERWRYRLPDGPANAPLRGWILPDWGDAHGLIKVNATERLQALLANLALRAEPPQPDILLRLTALPCYRFLRPRTWATAAGAERLLDALAA